MRDFKKITIYVLLTGCAGNVFAAQEIRDPTKPLDIIEKKGDVEIRSVGAFNLSGIIIDGNNKKAIINNKVLKEGDLIEGMEVTKIEHERVLLSGKQGEVKLQLFGNPIKGVPK